MSELSCSDFPESFLLELGRDIWNYTIGFLVVKNHEGQIEAILKGSGVLIMVGDSYGILTAQHVIRNLPNNGKLGLILSQKNETSNIDIAYLTKIEIGIPERGKEKKGPDIGVIKLTAKTASEIGSVKSFYNLFKRTHVFESNDLREKEGPWYAQGFVEELTQEDVEKGNKNIVNSYCQYGAIGGIEDYVVRDNYDYFKFPIESSEKESDPYNFGGISGGGLWQVTLKKNEAGEYEQDQLLLRGSKNPRSKNVVLISPYKGV